ncbi:DUF4365 domain-containing protein [Micromonospora sp. NPDC047753]|uniref:DUF4365 domain-containing protein n=1 Tax=Micromonospora sp. NPDC047753 TaxID=3154817 RepID=UPI0033D5E959
MTQLLTTVTGDAGIHGVGLLVNTRLGWHFRPQPVADVGIDAQVESVVDGVSTGCLLGLQIKSGQSMFSEPAPDGSGWVYRERSQTHRRYWLRYPLPVLLVLYQPDTHTAYWQVVTDETAVATGAGFKVRVPSTQQLDAGSAERLAELARRKPDDAFGERLRNLPSGCADRLVALRQTAPDLAQQLAEELVNGRRNPRATVEKIIAEGGERPWLAWSVLADYANEHNQALLAADCFRQTAESCPNDDLAGRFFAFAGLLLADLDRERAHALLTRASSAGARGLAGIGIATLEHGERKGPISLPPLPQGDQGRVEPTILRFMAEQRTVAGDFDGAVELHEKALALSPDAPAQQIALAEALLRRPRPKGGGSQLEDYHQAAALAASARSARRRWGSDSTRPAEILLQARAMAGDERSAVRVALQGPEGEATDAEAGSPNLAFYAARLCYELGELDRGDRLAKVVEASGRRELITHCAAVRAQACNAGKDVQAQRWQEALNSGAAGPHRLVALQNLAQLGRWPIPDLDEMRDDGHLTEGIYDLLHAQALAASGQPDAALSLLRVARDGSVLVAEEYARQLAAAGRVDECVRACDHASLRFGDPRLSLYALEVLTDAERTDEVILRANMLLGRADLPISLRHLLRGKLTDIFTERRDWLSCERLGHDGLSETRRLRAHSHESQPGELAFPSSTAADLDGNERDYAWSIVISQYNQGNAERAFETLQTFDPAPRTVPQLQAWTDLHRLQGWTPASAEQALAIAEHDRTPGEVVGRLLFSLVQTCRPSPNITAMTGGDVVATDLSDPPPVPVSEELHLRLTQAWTRFLSEHDPARAVRIDADVSQIRARPDDPLDLVTALPQHAAAAVHAGQAALGSLSLATGLPYLLSLADDLAGVVPAVDPSDAVTEAELSVAKKAIGGTVSIETSAVYLAAAVAQLWPTVRAAFLNVRIAKPVASDILHSHLAANSRARAARDPTSSKTGRLSSGEMSSEQKRSSVVRTAATQRAAQDCQLTDVAAPVEDLPAAPGAVTTPWVAAVLVAKQNGIPLYSDDVALRAWARSQGVPAFGTLALVEALLDAGTVIHVEPVVTKLFRGNVVDLPSPWPLVVQALECDGPMSPHARLNLTRPAFWQATAAEEVGPMVLELTRLARDDADGLGALVAACAKGLTAALEPVELVLGSLGATVLAYLNGSSSSLGATVVRAVQDVGARLDIDPLPALRQRFVAIMTDPAGPYELPREEAHRAFDQILYTVSGTDSAECG